MNVPLFDLKSQYQSIKTEIKEAINNVLESGQFVLGGEVSALEDEISKFLNVKHAIACASGTDALLLSLSACNIKPGDEVITTPFTFVATAQAISHKGATPIFVDICEDTFNIDITKISEKITQKTKAIMPVHMYGQSADMDEIMTIAKKHNLYVIEDAAQGFGAEYRKKSLGTMGTTGCFSFFPSKNFGAYGDAGMVVTNDDKIAKLLRKLRVHGSDRKYHHDLIGYNSRLDAMQAAILRVKLNYIEKWNNRRREIGLTYTKRLSGIDGITIPKEKDGNKHIYHQYALLLKNRDELVNFLSENGVGAAIHYPLTVNEQECYKFLNQTRNDLPLSYNVSKNVLCLPVFPELSDDQINFVCDKIIEFAR